MPGAGAGAREAFGVETSITLPSRAITSCMLETVLSKSASEGASTMTGTSSSISAIGPCLSSPDA